MDKVKFGKTGADVSALCLGTDYYGSRTDVATAHRLLDQFFDSGGTFIDTANIYAFWLDGFEGGESETTIGRWLQTRAKRQQAFLATKVGGGPYPGVERGLRAVDIERECEKSLRRLGVETIDLYYAHIEDRSTPQAETLEAFDHLVRAGKVRFIGVSNHPAWRIAEARTMSEANGWSSYCAVEQRFSYLRPKPDASFVPQRPVNDDLLDYCRHHDLPIVAYSILLNGAYTRADRAIPDAYRWRDTEVRLERLRTVAEATGTSPNQVIIAWMRQSSPQIVPIVGGSTPEQLAENIEGAQLLLSDAHMDVLNTPYE